MVRELDEVKDNGHIKTRRMKFNVDESADLNSGSYRQKRDPRIPGRRRRPGLPRPRGRRFERFTLSREGE